MKNFYILLVVCSFVLNVNAQSDIDTLKQKISTLEQQMTMQQSNYSSLLTNHVKIQQDFISFNRQFRIGTQLKTIGFVMSCTGLILSIDNSSEAFLFLSIAGAIAMFTGEIVHLDSHKYLGGRFSFTVYPNGITITPQIQKEKRKVKIRGARIE